MYVNRIATINPNNNDEILERFHFLIVFPITIIEKNINSDKPIYVDEDAVIAFEEKLNYEWITGGMKKLITSGEGALYKFSGRGKLWIQTKDEIEYKKD